jgi:hypothetical protein
MHLGPFHWWGFSVFSLAVEAKSLLRVGETATANHILFLGDAAMIT